MCPECYTKDWQGKSSRLNPWESGPWAVQGPGGVTISDLHWPRLGVKPAELSEVVLTVSYFESWAAAPVTLPRRKAGMKMYKLRGTWF